MNTTSVNTVSNGPVGGCTSQKLPTDLQRGELFWFDSAQKSQTVSESIRPGAVEDR